MTARVHLVNPSNLSFGVAVITPRWLHVLAAATGDRWGEPHIVDETLDPLDFGKIAPGDVVGIGIHTGNALRGYQVGREVRTRGGWVLVEPREHRLLRAIENLTKQKIEVCSLPTVADLRGKRLELTRAALRERIIEGDFEDV